MTTSLDNVFSNQSSSFGKLISIENTISDHNIVLFELNLACRQNRYRKITYEHFDHKGIKLDLPAKLDVDSYCAINPEYNYNVLLHNIEEVMNKYKSVVERRVDTNHNVAPWINNELEKLMKLKQLYRRKAKRNEGSVYSIWAERLSKVISRINVAFTKTK